MKTAFLTLLLIPFLIFGQVAENDNQLSKHDKQSIDQNTISMCDCVSNLMSTLHPKTVDIILFITENGQEEAMKEVSTLLGEMDEEEAQQFLGSFTKLESEEFLLKIDDCIRSDEFNPSIKEQIDNSEGDAHNYLLEVLDREESCEIMKAFYDLGSVSDE